MKPIVIIAELDQEQGCVRPMVRELATCASALQTCTHGPVIIVVPGRDIGRISRDLSRESNLSTVGLDIPGYTTYNSDVLKACLGELLSGMAPSYILVSHTSQGRDYAPGLAVRLGGVSIPGIIRVVVEADQCRAVRPVLGGRMDALVQAEGSPVLFTVQPGAFEPSPWPVLPGEHSAARSAGARRVTAPQERVRESRIRNLGIIPAARESSDFTRARVIVAGGRGIGGPEALDTLRELTSLFPLSALGASRPIIDAGWLPHRYQVGVTGAVVTPDVYIALGISGSTQHLAGMKGSGFVVAVNTDPGAAIFNHADLCIVEDFKAFADAFTAVAKAGKRDSDDPDNPGSTKAGEPS